MNTVFFGEKNSYKDYDLILTKKKIGSPAPKLLSVDIPGADGSLDYSEWFGDVHYSNRVLTFEFTMIKSPKTFLEQFTKILNDLNGREAHITLSDDAEYYYIGRIIVNEWASEKRIGKVVIDVEARPYKLKKAVTVISVTATEKTLVSCKNGRKKVQPVFTLSNIAALTFNGMRAVYPAGSFIDENIFFTEGENVITVEPIGGSVNVSIEYQEGDL